MLLTVALLAHSLSGTVPEGGAALPHPATVESSSTSLTALPAPHAWSVGAGLQLSSSLAPSAAVERRLWEQGWLLVDASASIARAPTSVSEGATIESFQWIAGASVGLRFQLVEDSSLIRPSVLVLAALNGSSNEQLTTGTPSLDTDLSLAVLTRRQALTAGARVGGLIDFELLPWLALRFSSSVVSGDVTQNWSQTRTRVADQAAVETEDEGLAFSAGLSLSPALTLQAFF